MAEEVMIENQPELEPNTPSKGKKFLAALKEWWRKRIVALKVRPQKIPLWIMVITTVYFMLILYSLSWAVEKNYTDTTASGICVFITTLVSLLFIVSYLNAFPKRKKANIFFIVLVFVMIAGQIACDLAYYFQMDKAIDGMVNHTSDAYKSATRGQPLIIGHVVLLGLSAIAFALLPVYSKLIKKINTSIKVDSATEHMGEKIDIAEDED